MAETGTFASSSGEPIAYDLYGATGPGVLLCQGLSGIKRLVMPQIAARLADAGYVCLAFDYRGFGDSGGDRGWIDPAARLSDAHDALDFLRGKANGEVGVYGLSLGGGIAYALGCERRDVACVALTSGFASGTRLMRGLRTASEFVLFKERLEHGDAQVPINDLFPFPPSFQRAYHALPEQNGGRQSSSVPQAETLFHLASGHRIMRFDVLERLAAISPTPLLIQHGDRDDVIPVEDAIEAYRLAGNPKRLVIHPGYDHIGLDQGPGLDAQLSVALEFLKEFLPVQRFS